MGPVGKWRYGFISILHCAKNIVFYFITCKRLHNPNQSGGELNEMSLAPSVNLAGSSFDCNLSDNSDPIMNNS